MKARTIRVGERKPLARGTRGLATALTLLSVGPLGLAACGGGDEPTTRSADASAQPRESAQATDARQDRTFVGKLEATDANIAVNVGEGFAHAYVCDSKRIWGLLSGSVQDGRLKLSSNTGEALVASVAGETVTGTVTLKDGTKRSFTASPAKGDAGLYQLAKQVDGTRYVTRWVKANDGSVRGKTTTQLTSQPADAETSVEATDGAGSQSVPPDASQPESRGVLDRFRCSRTKSKYNTLIKTLNDRGGSRTATSAELDHLLNLGLQIDTYCGAGASAGSDIQALNP